MTNFQPHIVFFGCPLDSDEQHEAFLEKQRGHLPLGFSDDPYQYVMELVSQEIPEPLWESRGSLPVPDWLRPMPSPESMPQVTPEAVVEFIDRDGCRQAAESLRQVVASEILPNIPCLIGVDHSLTGGTYSALADRLGVDNLSLVIIDSHTDAVPMGVLAGAIAYDMDTNSNSLYDPTDPLLYNRSDSYNASSFIHHLLKENRVDPKNLFLIGVGDIPDKKVARIKDVRMTQYVETFTRLKRRGVGLLTKKDLTMRPSKLNHLMGRIKTPYVYVSIDMDIGADNALEGVRFHNRRGISEKQIYRLADALRKRIQDGAELAGMDLCEFNPRRAGGPDGTYRIAANLIAKIAFGRNCIRSTG